MDAFATSSEAGIATIPQPPAAASSLPTATGSTAAHVVPSALASRPQHAVHTIEQTQQFPGIAAHIERSMQQYHLRFVKEHSVFSNSIVDEITDEDDRKRYSLLMLNRLAFLAFLQEKGFLNEDRSYLQTHLRWAQTTGTSYQSFLSTLFHKGLNAPSRSSGLEQQLGKVPYLNMDLFGLHALELKYPDRKIPNRAFEKLLQFFAEYHWQLDDDAERGVTDITPETFSRTLQQIENDKEKAVFYTKKDITDYISKNAILPYLLEELERIHTDVFSSDSSFWSLLHDNFDDYTNGIGEKEKAKVKIASIQDLITSNLDSGKLAKDFIATSERPNVLLTCYESLEATTVLDPTCGTGAFLFAASHILSSLYEACLIRMQEMVDRRGDPLWSPNEAYPVQTTRFRAILKEAGNAPSRRYFILKSILTKNLYGADIMGEAIEVAHLCLNLKLLAQVEKPKDWSGESFSSGGLNLRVGNALVGFDWDSEFQQVMRRGKFRVIIGNPPYAEFKRNKLSYIIPQSFETLKCLELYTCVIEKSRQLLSDQGYMGMIIPIGAFSAKGKLPFLDWFYLSFLEVGSLSTIICPASFSMGPRGPILHWRSFWERQQEKSSVSARS